MGHERGFARKGPGRLPGVDLENNSLRPTGIAAIGNAPWGTHFCQFYQTQQDLIDILVPYFKAGLENNEFCMWVTSKPLGTEEAKAALRTAVPDLDRYLQEGQMEVLDYSQWYTRSGSFQAEEVLQGWGDKLNLALAKGYEGLRLTGNTFWLEKTDWAKFTDYEAMINRVIGRYRILALCTYSMDRCGALEVIDVVSNHQFALIKKAGAWEIIESFQHKTMEAALHESEATLRGFFDTRTAYRCVVELLEDDFVFVRPNPLMAEFFDLTVEEMAGRTGRAIGLPEEVVRHWVDLFRQGLKDGREMTLEYPFASRGEERRYQVTIVPIAISPAVRPRLSFRALDITDRKQAEETMAWLASFPKLNPYPVIEVDLDGRVHYLNPAAQGLFPDLEQRGQNHPWLGGWEPLARAFHEGRTKTSLREVTVGEHSYQQMMHYVEQDRRVRIYGIDITKRKAAEEALRESQKDLNRAQAVAHTGSWRLDIRRDELLWSDETYRIFGIPQGTPMTYEAFLATVLPEDRAYVDQKWMAALRGEPYDIEHRIVVEGNVKWVRERAQLEFDEQGVLCGGFGTVQDITERKAAEEELRQAKEGLEQRVQERTAQLRKLASDLTLAEQRERQRIARVLHDHLQQLLVGAQCWVGTLQKARGKAVREAARELGDLISQSIQTSRTLTGELSPPILLESGLIPALEWLTHAMQEKYGLAVELKAEDQTISTSEELAVLLFQAVRELLFNVVKHAQVKKASVQVHQSDEKLQIMIQDAGVGFDPTQLRTQYALPGGIGLFDIRDRLDVLGGLMEIDSAPGRGSRITLTAPLRRQDVKPSDATQG